MHFIIRGLSSDTGLNSDTIINNVCESIKNAHFVNDLETSYRNGILPFIQSFRQYYMNIYNMKSTLEEIRDFNKEVHDKTNRILTPEVFFKKFIETIKNLSLYRNKIEKFHDLIQKKLIFSNGAQEDLVHII